MLSPPRSHSTSMPMGESKWAPPMGRALSTESDRGRLLLFAPPLLAEQQQPATQIIQWALIPTGRNDESVEAVERANASIQSVLTTLAPTIKSECQRTRVVSFVKGIVNRVLGVQCYALGHFELKTYLPKDTLEMTVIFPKQQDDTWFVTLNQALLSSPHKEDLVCGEVNFNSETRMLRLSVNDINVEISGNRLDELTLVAFFERFDRDIGKDHLFKRTLLLIKAWATYESRSFTGRCVNDIISGYALAVLVCVVFTRHRARLHTPLQAMSVFFLVYSKVDWHAQEIRMDPKMIGALVEEYAANYTDAKRKLRIGGASNHASTQAAPITVIDPLDPQSNLAADVTAADAADFKRLLEAGAKALKPLLQHIQEDADRVRSTWPVPPQHTNFNSTSVKVDSFFSQCREVFDIREGSEERAPLASDLECIKKSLDYCALLLFSKVTEPALVTLVTVILKERGAQPVGEIGKFLRDYIDHSITTTIKEKFKGLKNFLKRNHRRLSYQNPTRSTPTYI